MICLDSCSDAENLNAEQKTAIVNIAKGSSRPVPYLLFGPAGTGKTRTLVAAIEHIVKTTQNHILVCASANSACDEITQRLLGVLKCTDIFRMYAKSYKKTSLKPEFESVCNLKEGEFQFPPLEHLYKFRVLICTLVTAGSIVRANGADGKFDSKHFSHIFIDESACTHESMALIPIAGNLSLWSNIYFQRFDETLLYNIISRYISTGLCTEPTGQVHSSIVLAGDPKQLDAVTKSNYAKELGFSKSWMEQLCEKPLYQPNPMTKRYNSKYITKLVKNYRSHKDILAVPNALFYDNELVSQAKCKHLNYYQTELHFNTYVFQLK